MNDITATPNTVLNDKLMCNQNDVKIKYFTFFLVLE